MAYKNKNHVEDDTSRNITRREFAKRITAGFGGAVLFNQWPSVSLPDISHNPGTRPNILFISSDQHTYNCTGYAGHPFVKTPNLDRIAREGTVFSNAYVGSPLCTPGRSCMMTGMFPSDCNSFGNYTVWDGKYPTWRTLLQEAGYHTWAIGKIELNPGFPIGFDDGGYENPHYHNGDIMELFRRPVGYRVNERAHVDGESRALRDDHDTDVLKKARNFIRRKLPGVKKPWATYVGFTEPHPPYIALDEYFHYYYPNRVDMPNVPPGLVENLDWVYQQLRHFKCISAPVSDERIRKARAGYYGRVTELDEYVGQLLDDLEKTGQLENTIIIYTSDHGDSLGRHGLWFKNNLYEGAVHVPLVMSGPGIPKGKVIDHPISHVDMVYTLLEWCGAKTPSALRGHSLSSLLMDDKSGNHPEYVYSESHCCGMSTGCFMIRKGDWKYMHNVWYDDLLYNLSEDPMEFTNRINDPSAKKIKDELNDILHSLVDPEEVTLRAFHLQESKLTELGRRLDEKELTERFQSRMGAGQARVLANKYALKKDNG